MHIWHLESIRIPLQLPHTSQLYQQFFLQRSKLVPRGLRFRDWILADPTTTCKLVEVLTRVWVLVQTLQDSGRCNSSRSTHKDQQDFRSSTSILYSPTSRISLYIWQFNPSHNVVLPTNMWKCSWSFTSSGRVDVLPDKCLLMCGHTQPRTQHLLLADRVLYNNHVYIGDRLLKPCYMSTDDHNQKIRTRKQRTDVGKYPFINRTIKSWNQLPAGLLASFPCKLNAFRKRVKNVVTSKGIEVGVECK